MPKFSGATAGSVLAASGVAALTGVGVNVFAGVLNAAGVGALAAVGEAVTGSTTIAADLEHDPAGAAVLSDGVPLPRRFAGGAYFRGITLAARSICGRLEATRELIGVRR